ncbi:MAG: hypothetical protein AAF081_13725 [Actinomycetota bacterium]
MRRRLWLLVALCVLAGSCGGANEVAVIERQVSADESEDPHTTVCHAIEAFAMGSHAGDDLFAVIDEAARLAALLGASEALPHLADMKAAIDAGDQTARSLDAAAEALDEAGHAECSIPVFTAMYVTTSFASCFGRAPVAAGTMVPDSEGCEPDLRAEFLPCFDDTDGYIPVDCRTGAQVVLRDGEWIATP